ncbi:sucrose-6-phosphate hydrolase SacC (GH32 family) [Microbacterium testaceum]|nr:glycoside hydrolase family 32 protein [Microbacterium testaceum]MDQ1113202.1 sucrose-6-phosphate hydrolase SacC (GH32 family) [Microbacterium testaceum]
MDIERHARTLSDPDAPLFHLASPYGRINDPNGLIVVDGVAHAFYQWGPAFPERGIGWGHATSRDLLRWTHHGMAFEPDAAYDRDGCYSGSAVPAGAGADLLYTGNVKNPDGTREAHQVRVHTDDFVAFEKDPAGPFLPDADRPAGYTAHFRDPMVYGTEGGRLRMCLGAQRDDETGAVLLYSAPDAEGPWRFDGELTVEGLDAASAGYMWECPNIFRLTDLETGVEHDVLVLCPQGATDADVNPFGVADVCGYVVGHLDGSRLRDTGGFRLIDAGFEFYAPQVFAGRGDADDALLLAWAGLPAQDDQPSRAHGWVHTLSAPRSLTLRGGVLHQRLAPARADFGATTAVPAATLSDGESVGLLAPGDAIRELDEPASARRHRCIGADPHRSRDIPGDRRSGCDLAHGRSLGHPLPRRRCTSRGPAARTRGPRASHRAARGPLDRRDHRRRHDGLHRPDVLRRGTRLGVVERARR